MSTEYNPITENYADHTKDELLAELERRDKSSMVTSHSTKGDIVAALELIDEQAEQDKAGESFPQGEKQPDVNPADVVKSNPPRNTDFDKNAVYVKTKGDFEGEEFALAIHEEDSYGRTHSLRNKEHFWQGNKQQFSETFQKK